MAMRTATKKQPKVKTVVSQRVSLKRAGGSLIMTVPSRVRDALALAEGQELDIVVDGDKLVVEKAKPARPIYALADLLADCDFETPYSDEEKAWLDVAPVGRELL